MRNPRNIPTHAEVCKPAPEAALTEPEAAARGRKQLYWVVLGVVVLNIVLFMRFGLEREAEPTPFPSATNQPAASVLSNGTGGALDSRPPP